MTTVVYVGNFVPPNSTEHHYAASFAAAGCTVIRVQENADGVDRIVDEHVRSGHPDLLLYTRTWNSVGESTAALLSDPPDGVVSAAVHLDVWFDLDRAEELSRSPMFRAQHVFTADGRYPTRWETLGINHHWLPPAVVDPALVGETVPGRADPHRWPYDVVFVGSRAYHHEWPFRRELIGRLAAEFGDRFAHVGGDGTVRGRGGGAVRGQELDDLYATVPVAVGDSCFATASDVRYVSDRAYEAPGRGAFSVFPHLDFVADELRPVGSQVYYRPGDADDAVRLTRDWVERFRRRPAERAALVAAGAEWIAEHASYTARARTILNVLGLTP